MGCGSSSVAAEQPQPPREQQPQPQQPQPQPQPPAAQPVTSQAQDDGVVGTVALKGGDDEADEAEEQGRDASDAQGDAAAAAEEEGGGGGNLVKMNELSRSRGSIDIMADMRDEPEADDGGPTALGEMKLKGGEGDDDDDAEEEGRGMGEKMGALTKSRGSVNMLADLADEPEGSGKDTNLEKMGALARSKGSMSILMDLEDERNAALQQAIEDANAELMEDEPDGTV